jgi:hypothetical protein
MTGPMDVHISSMVRCQEHVAEIKLKFDELVLEMEQEVVDEHMYAIRCIRDLLKKPMGV